MYPLIISLFFAPLLISGLVLIIPKTVLRVLVITASIILSGISVCLFLIIREPFFFGFPAYLNTVISVADILLLLYFGAIAVRKKSVLVGLLTVLQLGTVFYLLTIPQTSHEVQFRVDRLSVFMFLLINVISSLIAIFSLQYIEGEHCSAFRKKYFLSIIFWFIAVMNLIVSSDNLEYFFLFFELTTLASYLFIGFRKDSTAIKNAVTALWMNQIGGLAILAAIYFITNNKYGPATFSNLLAHASAPGILIPLALLSVAALIKGAQMPFSKWLLGAMVAPTPVSALLHSSTMVKIAPFMILRLSPALKGTPVASVIIALTGFVFVAAAILSLSQDNFKRILAYSTIALLSFMIMMGAIGTPVTIVAALILIFFHGISKSMLFLQAGILEREYHLKEISGMDKLGESSPFTALVITVGLLSLLLPPFGAFIGKWFSIETLGPLAIQQKLLGAFVIVAIACGGAVLSLLYFKVMGTLIARSGIKDQIIFGKMKNIYTSTTYVLLGFIILGVLSFPILITHYFVPVASGLWGQPIAVFNDGWHIQIGAMRLPVVPLLIAFLLMPVTIVLSMFIHFKKVDRAKEYMCGEKIDYSFSAFYFQTENASPYFSAIGLLFFVALILVSVV